MEGAASLVEVLGRYTGGRATLTELAEALGRHPRLVLVVPPAQAAGYLTAFNAAPEAGASGAAGDRRAGEPRPLGLEAEGGFLPKVFTGPATAQAHVKAIGLVGDDEVLITHERSPAAWLFESLNGRHGGWLVDPGAAHEVRLDRPALARLYALLTREPFAREPALHALCLGEAPYLERSSDGGVYAFVYDSGEGAAADLRRDGMERFAARPTPTRPLLQSLLAAGATRLVVNHSMTTERWYSRDEVAAMIGRGDGAPGPGPAGAGRDPALGDARGDRAGAGPPGSAPAGPAGSRRLPVPPMVPPPGRADAESERAARALAQHTPGRSLPLWAYIRTFAYDLDLHVPVLARRVDGHRWPLAHEEAGGGRHVRAWSRQDRLQELLASLPADERGHVHVAGAELLRWIWAAPVKIGEVHIDAVPGRERLMAVPTNWVFGILYPHFVDVPDPAAVPTVPLGRLTGLPGAAGLQPEVARALVQGWKRLLGTRARSGGPPPLVEHQGRRYLPAFTTDDQFFAYGSANRAFDGVPARADAEPPFGRWLATARDGHGVILDPAAPRPLVLDHTDLLALELWCRTSRQPQGVDLAAQVERLRAADAISARVGACIVADWPGYWVGARSGPGSGVSLLKMPRGDALPAFTTAPVAAAYIETCRGLGWIEGDWKPQPILHRWNHSVFHLARLDFADGLFIDPIPDGSAGVAIQGEALEAAVERIHERLAPRVPGFFADG